MKGYRQKKPLSQTVATVVAFLLFVYFAAHLLHGGQGYFAHKGLQSKIAQAEQKRDEKRQERIALENRVQLLRPDGIDIDLLDERARVVLGFVHEEEKIVLSHR